MTQYRLLLLALYGLLTFNLTGCLQPLATPQWRQSPPPPATIWSDAEQAPWPGERNTTSLQDGVRDLSIDQAVLLSLQNNGDLGVHRLEPLVRSAEGQRQRSVFDPELSAAVSFSAEKEDSSLSDDETTQTIGASSAVSQQLPTGTELEAAIEYQRQEEEGDQREYSTRLGLSVTQSLLRGFSLTANVARIFQADLDTKISLYELRGYTEALVAETEIAYWNYVLAHEEITIFENSYKVVKKQREEIELRIGVGILPEMAAAAVQAEEARRVQDLIDARSTLERRRLELLQLLSPGSEDHYHLQLTTTSPPQVLEVAIDNLEDRLMLATKSRADRHEALLRHRQNRLETLMTRNGLLPRLDLFIQLGKTGYADSFGNAVSDLGGDGYDATAGLRFSHVLGNRSRQADHLAARASLQQSRLAIANLEQLINLDVRLAINEVQRSRSLIDASRATRISQEATLEAEKERFDVGTSTTLLVAQAHRDLLQSRIDEIEAIIAYRIALIRLYLAEGSLLERRGLVVGAESATNSPGSP